MSDSDKTKKELIEELEALRAKLGQDSKPDTPADSDGGVSRRDVLQSAWVAPVILTVPVGATVGSSQKAFAQTPTITPGNPTPMPLSPTVSPTFSPTTSPTVSPTLDLSPTLAPNPPTPAPTVAPTAVPATSPFPTAAPAPSPEVIPVDVSEFNID